MLALLAPAAAAETLRIATYNVGLDRDGPGLLLRDILAGKAADAEAAADAIRKADPDILLLTGFDYDAGGVALAAFARLIGPGAYPHRFALRPNTGWATGLDLDGDGRRGGPGDAQGYGAFAGQGGMALLSRLPLDNAAVQDLSTVLWRDLSGADLPRRPDGTPFPSDEALAVQRLSTTGHWVVPVLLPGGGRLDLLAFYASPPVFDGPEDRNGRRAADELRLWTAYLDGGFGGPPAPLFVVLGDANLDPGAGDGDHDAIARFLADPRLTDPHPRDAEGALTTTDWPVPPGPLRVDYVLPSATLRVLGSGLGAATGGGGPLHRLVWVDVALPRAGLSAASGP
ncbi:endonuclease/exonuclease/phosphatase family protein [Frigidibacter sp. ROC022]|uniref:endonuclease/exonuclease/phosphatase family protein n=1 Tax=Frigidibacter sp. ROC022 TaxID=2971796 RepID=UPI00215B40DC|nr:endonuclease/exonuclease/phosphatase family protein [Frigidibacter sp. ROC022]MCR8724252.1 endonuclease/exonuclease/phosphatase family protein [Frigidibacter sp. ROC022]